jgi:hypothetical protein
MATLNAAGTTSQKGATAQYQKSGTVAGAYDSTQITPAAAAATIIGTVPPGKAGIRLTSPVIQNSTDPLVSGQLANNQADNFLASTTGSGLTPTVNAAQLASAGKSLAPEHE